MSATDRSAAMKEERPSALKRPGVVLLVYAYHLLAAFFLALPFAALLGRAVGEYPRRDALLFEPGGAMLIEGVRRTRDAVPAIGAGTMALLVASFFVGLLPLAALLGALTTKGRLSARDLGAFALRPVGTFSLLLGLSAIVQAILGGVIVAIGGAIARRSSFDVREGDRVKIIFALIALVAVLLVGVVHDLARAAAVRSDLGLRASLRRALAAMKRAPVGIVVAWGSRAALAFIALAGSFALASRLGVETRGAVVVGFFVHQLSVAAATFLRASWLAAALAHVDVVAPVEAPQEEPKGEDVALLTTSAPEVAPVQNAESAAVPPGVGEVLVDQPAKFSANPADAPAEEAIPGDEEKVDREDGKDA